MQQWVVQFTPQDPFTLCVDYFNIIYSLILIVASAQYFDDECYINIEPFVIIQMVIFTLTIITEFVNTYIILHRCCIIFLRLISSAKAIFKIELFSSSIGLHINEICINVPVLYNLLFSYLIINSIYYGLLLIGFIIIICCR